MAVAFVIGRAGSGKSHHCFESIVEALRADPLGPPIFWILPKQATFMAERQLACAGGLGGYCRARVVSFETLAEEVLMECGGAAVPEVTAGGRQMIFGHLLRENQGRLRFFGGVAHHSGLASQLDATLGELERSGKDATHIAALLREKEFDINAAGSGGIGADDGGLGGLAAKLHDLHLIFDAYARYLGQDRLDQHLRLAQFLTCIGQSKLFPEARVYVDNFGQFTQFERVVLARLGKVCRRVEIMLIMDPGSVVLREADLLPDELSLFHPTEMAYRALRRALHAEGVVVEEPATVLAGVRRFKKPALAAIESRLFAGSIPKGVKSDFDCGGLTFLEASNRREEVDAAAQMIRQWSAEGLRYRDIGLLTRDLGGYGDLIAASFVEHGIPYFVDRRRSAEHHPLITLVRQMLIIAGRSGGYQPILEMCKCGLAGVTPDDADRLENLLVQSDAGETGLIGAKGSGKGVGEDDGDVEAARMQGVFADLMGRLQPFVEIFGKAGEPGRSEIPLREIVLGLFALLDRFEVRKTIAQWIDSAKAAGELEQQGEHEQVWANFIGLFDQMVDLLGDERMSLDDFREIVESGLAQFDLALTPPTVDQVVVGQVDRTRFPEVRAMAVMGMNEGVFPKATRENSVLSDLELRELDRRQLEFGSDTQRRLLDENLLGYIALTRATERMWVSRALSDESGRPLGPSPFWRRLRQMFPQIQPARAGAQSGHSAEIRDIGTPRQLVTALMRWARTAEGERQSDGAWAWLYEWFRSPGADDRAFALIRRRAWPALSYRNGSSLSAETARELFGSPLRGEVRRLETFAACAFRHFAGFGLELQQREERRVSSGDLGGIFHRVLQYLVGQMLRRNQTWNDLDEERRRELIHDFTLQAGRELRGQIMMSRARSRYLLQRAEKTIDQVVQNQAAVQSRGTFQPTLARVAFGGKGAIGAYQLRTPRGNLLELRGSIDRVDALKSGSAEAFPSLVIDYKLGGGQVSLEEVYYGLSLQLLTYLLVLEASGKELAGRALTPVGAFYVRLLRGLGTVAHPSEAISMDDPAFALKVKQRGIFNQDFLEALDAALENGASEVVRATITKSGEVGSKSRSDGADGREFAGILKYVRGKLGELADAIIEGNIEVRPYRLRQKSPCAQCGFLSVCRFEPSVNGYRHLGGIAREEVLERVAAAAGANGKKRTERESDGR